MFSFYKYLFLVCLFLAQTSAANQQAYERLVEFMFLVTSSKNESNYQNFELELKNYDINYREPIDGYSLLTIASENNFLRMVKILLKNGADPNLQMQWGNTSLHQAIIYGHLDVATKLIENGANLHLTTADGQTPLMMAILHNQQQLIIPLCQSFSSVKEYMLSNRLLLQEFCSRFRKNPNILFEL